MLSRLILMLAMSCGISNIALADELTAEKYSDIERFLEVTGSASYLKEFATASKQQLFQGLKSEVPEMPDKALAVMEKEYMAVFTEKLAAPGGLKEQIVHVYDKYYTHQDVRELLAFYQSPIGKKLNRFAPSVFNEVSVAAQRWVQSIRPEFVKRTEAALKREGLFQELSRPPQPASPWD